VRHGRGLPPAPDDHRGAGPGGGQAVPGNPFWAMEISASRRGENVTGSAAGATRIAIAARAARAVSQLGP
jgi:hypothetical protein